MKIKFTDIGRCLICLHNPCECKKEKKHCEHCNDTGVIDIGGSQSNGVPCNTENDCGLDRA